MAIDPVLSPSLLTDEEWTQVGCQLFVNKGYKVLWFQVQNGGNNPKDRNLAPIKVAGGEAGVWGVTYAVDDVNNNPRGLSFYDQNLILGKQAVKLGAQHLMVDAEDCLKNTRATRGASPMVLAIRAAGWTRPIHLTTLGAPFSSDVDDYEFDLASFLETGGGVFAQCYAQLSMSYYPAVTKKYFVERMGVPVDKFNAMVQMDGRITADTQVQLLKDASMGQAFSIFMAEFMDAAAWDAFKALAMPTPITVDPRLTLDIRLPDLRDVAQQEFSLATAKVADNWAAANPNEWKRLTDYLLHKVLFNEGVAAPTTATHIGNAGSELLKSAAALVGRLLDK